ncbi:acyl-coenzyme A diphosphatase FITM2-like [Paramacrobiotus metropolitanus]|uniref:acyl-coenzyme A diphosphatase FITM2-like n=1 Tax=Paramacrobiotus metropolitanus TaxID=2943436 RepID=UPI002445B738|nr:acyl-coenzyme A diphosphatase FITM2-like [Paramacrobiotus metropolitanus]XP_055336657.1 acyl-coenzyme A diphosphatase FITM2-like [Paramacrobiotus metropolitanus]XP_055336658.1 acyl-coenzyme A diphosphatase FITM2-like [Paramacrobiotus metropolitanus]
MEAQRTRSPMSSRRSLEDLSRNPNTMKTKASPSDVPTPPDHYAPPVLQGIHPILQWVLYLSKRFLQVPPIVKASFYFGLVIICSSLSYYLDPYRGFYFFRKESFLNQWFVKLSWGWTFYLLLAFFALAGYLESDGRIKKIKRNVARLLVGTATWYFVTTVFVRIEHHTARCSVMDYHSRKECEAAGQTWSYFDISGHAFLLIYCSLLILEESRAFFKWEKADRLDTDEDAGKFDQEIKPRVLLVMRVLAVALAMLAMLWDGMLVITLIYYHSFIQRFMGVFFGVAGWFLTYKVWYPNYWPGLPEDVSPLLTAQSS